MKLQFHYDFLRNEEIAPKKGYPNGELYVIIHRPGMECGVFVSKQIHLDERLVAFT